MEESKNILFKNRIRCTEECSIGKRREKKTQILICRPTFILLPSVEDRATESNLISPNNGNEDEEERNISKKERTEVPRNIRRKKERKKPKFLMRNRSCPNTHNVPPSNSHFASNPRTPQPATSMQNSESLSRQLSSIISSH
jgi:hypothetical protein